MIEFRNVYLRYGDREVLSGISFVIPEHTLVAVLGPSGSGKSTILKLSLGLIKPSEGQVLVDGIDITNMPEEKLYPIRRKMGMVFQGNALFDSLNVVENLGFFLRENMKLPEEEIEKRIKGAIEFSGLAGFEYYLPDSLSGGMRKRLAIARALIFDPSTVLFDEPTVGLDPVTTKRILEVIKRLKHERSLGAVFVTHIIGDVFAVADRVIVLYQGKIIFNDVPEMMQESKHDFVQSFLADDELMEHIV